jgi:hypothetical protein
VNDDPSGPAVRPARVALAEDRWRRPDALGHGLVVVPILAAPHFASATRNREQWEQAA